MATQSIKKNIIISDEKSASIFVEALEKAATIATKSDSYSYKVTELKGADRIKAFLGDKL